MSNTGKVTSDHLRRAAYLYVRQSSLRQVRENRESTARQYDLKRRAHALGWARDEIVIIDEDLGLSGASGSQRDGFQRLVVDVGLGRVGLVMGLEVSRLARNSTEWHRLLEICALTETLILDEDGIYDPAHFNDRLLLGLKGTMSEAELHVLRARLLGGQVNKARRGELWLRPPIGYIYDGEEKLVFDPDEQINGAVRLIFETFRRTASALRVVRHFSEHGVQWPRRISKGSRVRSIEFVALAHSRVLNILHNPRYAGAYVYGRTRQRKQVVGNQVRYRRLPREDWKVFLPNSHPAYITWAEYEKNQTTLQANARSYGYDRRRSPPREGTALLQGLVMCGRCGARMTVGYSVRGGRSVPEYICQRRSINHAEPVCQRIPGEGVDRAVGERVIDAVNPASLDVAIQVFEELRARQAQLDRQQRAQIDRARQDAELAQQQFMLVRPENRLVADGLEHTWNEKLLVVEKAEAAYSDAKRGATDLLNEEAKERIYGLVSDLSRVWNDARTPSRERKRMLRLMIDDVTLRRESAIMVDIRWKGGATSSFEEDLPLGAPDLRRTPAAIVESVRSLATEKTDREIAEILNARWLRTGTGKTFTRQAVRYVRTTYRIDSLFDHLRRAGWLTVPEISQQLRVHPSTAKRFANEGVLRAIRARDRGDILFEPPLGPLPVAHPGKRFRDRQIHPKLGAKVRKGEQYGA